MADKEITIVSPEQVARIQKIYKERFELEKSWRLEEASMLDMSESDIKKII